MSASLQSIASSTRNPHQPEILPFLTPFVRTGPSTAFITRPGFSAHLKGVRGGLWSQEMEGTTKIFGVKQPIAPLPELSLPG